MGVKLQLTRSIIQWEESCNLQGLSFNGSKAATYKVYHPMGEKLQLTRSVIQWEESCWLHRWGAKQRSAVIGWISTDRIPPFFRQLRRRPCAWAPTWRTSPAPSSTVPPAPALSAGIYISCKPFLYTPGKELWGTGNFRYIRIPLSVTGDYGSTL